jgi:hypothetical protein
MSSILLVSVITFATTPILAKRPKHKPKPCAAQKITEQEDDEKHVYQPNPIVLNGVGQIMNGALSIAQDPHNRPNIGHSVASMIHGIMSIIVEKFAHKKIDIEDLQALQDCCDEVCSDISREITEIIIAKGLLIQE